MTEPNRARARTEYRDGHADVVVTSMYGEWRGCGDTTCGGSCGLPKLTHGAMVVRSDMVTIGGVIGEQWRIWNGLTVDLPAEVGADLEGQVWI